MFRKGGDGLKGGFFILILNVYKRDKISKCFIMLLVYYTEIPVNSYIHPYIYTYIKTDRQFLSFIIFTPVGLYICDALRDLVSNA